MSGFRPGPGEDDVAGRLAAAELFFQHSRDLFALFGPNGEVLRLNPAWEALTGWTLEELSGSSFPALIHPEDFPALVKGLKNAFEGKSGRVNARFHTKSGEWRWLQGDSQLTPSGEIASVMRDVGEEQAQAEALAEARRAQELLSKSAGIGAWTYEPLTRRVAFSDDLLALTGWSDRQLDNPEKYLAVVHPDDVERVGAALGVGIDIGQPATIEHRMRSSDGRWTSWRATWRTEAREDGQFALFGVSQDITELTAARDRAQIGEQQVRQVIEASPYAVAMTNCDLNVTIASASMAELFARDGESLVGRPIYEASPRSTENLREAQHRALAGEVVVKAEEPITDAPRPTPLDSLGSAPLARRGRRRRRRADLRRRHQRSRHRPARSPGRGPPPALGAGDGRAGE
jgi:PAS domain S-box-containing protein